MGTVSKVSQNFWTQPMSCPIHVASVFQYPVLVFRDVIIPKIQNNAFNGAVKNVVGQSCDPHHGCAVGE
ncbi:hypothetical protein O0I10_002470 [Lichtheimia ornata]|uniref:Uncharacterized protein n=1 Tax=Lichtheimia ornata TaxID=688661 RepID=A0AAD7VAL7_9FUNG|nr:uncharacterized protein O0I10_002470 [Lichtheimia ornata]KAJ8661663.1 hypothetical protein O0I10_002470 [Lichtheimia ornata]